jgi:hypothetical protein
VPHLNQGRNLIVVVIGLVTLQETNGKLAHTLVPLGDGWGNMGPTTLKGTNGITFEGHDSGPF